MFDHLVKKVEKNIFNNLLLDKTLNVSYCADDKYCIPFGISVCSLLENNKNLNVIIHLFTQSLSEKNKFELHKLIANYDNVEFIIYYISNDFNINPENTINYPISASLRIIIPEILKNKCDCVLYLDSDTLITDSLIKLTELNIDKTVSVVIDSHVNERINAINLDSDRYFNSGVLFINIKKWCDNQISIKTFNLLSNNRYRFPDQDALNIVLSKQCLYLPIYYNFLGINDDPSYLPEKFDIDNVIVYHYAGQKRPWNNIFSNKLYCKYSKKTVFHKINIKNSLVNKVPKFKKVIMKIGKLPKKIKEKGFFNMFK